MKDKPNFKELRRLAKDRPLLLDLINDYEKLWHDPILVPSKPSEGVR